MKSVASLREDLTAVVFAHEVIQRNPYTKWFKLGEANTEQVVDLVVQFSVFSNHFIPLEAKRMVNAATEEEEKEARAILEIPELNPADRLALEERIAPHLAKKP